MVSPLDLWPAAACLFIVLALVATPAFQAADAPPVSSARRLAAFDGLRGLAAFGVLLHHASLSLVFLRTGMWQAPTSRLYAMAGPVGVSTFFMITGFLFWSALVRERGRPCWGALYVGRAFRIAPLFLVAVAAMMVIVLARDGLAVPPGRLVAEAGRWLSLGILQGGTFDGDPSADLVLAGVTWSLQFEWLFYAVLPVLALGAGTRKHVVTPVLVLAAALAWWVRKGPYALSDHDAALAFLFGLGMLAGSLEQVVAWRPPAAAADVAAAALLLATFATGVYGLAFALCLGGAFLALVAGGDPFNALSSRPLRRLGDVSYGVYLLQGPVLLGAFALPLVRECAASDARVYWAATLGACVITVCLATVAHAWVERPGVALGRSVIRRLELDRSRLAPRRERL